MQQASNNKSQSRIEELKIPPHSIEAEHAVLGGLMLDNSTWEKVSPIISEQDFYRYEHRLIFRAITDLAHRDQPLDVLTLSETLKNTQQLSIIGGEIYLFELAKNTRTIANIVSYANIVRERSVLRQLIGVGNNIAESAYHPKGSTSNQLLDAAEQRIFSIAEQNSRTGGLTNLSDLLAEAMEKIDKLCEAKDPITGLATGFKDLDELTSGLQPADLIIVAGRPSMGKTCFAMNIAEHAAIQEEKPVAIFSLEMPGSALAMRMLSSLGRIDQHLIRTGRLIDGDWPRLGSAMSMLSNAKMFIDDTPALSPGELRGRARRLAKEHGQLGLIVIDYLQLMQVPGYKENRTNEISEISRSLKSLAKELNVPVVACSQLNRGLEQRADKRPMMSDLRESGSIEQDADLILFIYRDEVYNDDSPDKGSAEIILSKHRNGPIGKKRLTFLGNYVKFENLAQNSYQGDPQWLLALSLILVR